MTVQTMGYFWVGTSKLDDWSSLAIGQLGLQTVDRGGNMRAFRMDDRKQRPALSHAHARKIDALTALSLEDPYDASACHCRGRTCTCFCDMNMPVPIGCEHFVVVGLARIEADTMALRGYKTRRSSRPERVLSLQLRR